MIIFDTVSVTAGNRTVLADISLTLRERRIAVIGANGSGKSTFARLINGLRRPSTGTVTVDGLDTVKAAKDVRRQVGFLFQDPDNQIVMPLVDEDLRFSLKALKLSPAAENDRVEQILDSYGLTHLRHQPSHSLSGGEKQLLALANSMLRGPRYLVLDEPTTLLDLKNRKRVMAAIDALEQTVICVTHDLEIAATAERVLILADGRIAFDGPALDAIAAYREMAG
ncbi:energy-coupling factor ABC transporter ATP-binding protein [Nisaea nitritireducens]|uniref:energy-coupling factor ABC transporter ATP-binding protein n=1 Tax=Nisaea nitritireducens TaxID=568392 RepID=UPI001865A3CE|nr:ABC transporter ATP-binding protein [Nisaea nitritireducens]